MENPSETGNFTDVLIVGSGPVGLMMACQLARHRISFRIVDKKDKPTCYSGALIVHARSMELFRQMGIADLAIQKGIIAREIKISFNGKKSFVIPIENLGYELTKFPFLLLLEQSITEELLTQYLQKQGFLIKRNTELMQISQNTDEVISILKSESGEEIVRSKYLIGADGAHSIVRKQLQIPFAGKSHPVPLFVSDCAAETEFPDDQICFSFTDHSTTGFFPLPGGRWRIDGAVPGKQKSKPTFEVIQQDFQEKTGTPVQLKIAEWFSVFQTSSRVAERYRENRCFLVGDAAHIHSPVGAQGMNTGLQDVANLAWKLASVVQGKAEEKLLETYELERRNIARNIVRHTDWVFDFVTTQNFFIRNFRVSFLPFLLKMAYPLLTTNKNLRLSFFRRLSGIAVQYRKSELSKTGSSGRFPANAPKPGDRLPFMTFSESNQLLNIQDKITGIKFHLLVFSNGGIPEEITRFAEEYANIISVDLIFFSKETKCLFERFGIKNFGFYLVRPDGYVACRSIKTNNENLKKIFLKSFGLTNRQIP